MRELTDQQKPAAVFKLTMLEEYRCLNPKCGYKYTMPQSAYRIKVPVSGAGGPTVEARAHLERLEAGKGKQHKAGAREGGAGAGRDRQHPAGGGDGDADGGAAQEAEDDRGSPAWAMPDSELESRGHRPASLLKRRPDAEPISVETLLAANSEPEYV